MDVIPRQGDRERAHLAPAGLVHEVDVEPAEPHGEHAEEEERVDDVQEGEVRRRRLPA